MSTKIIMCTTKCLLFLSSLLLLHFTSTYALHHNYYRHSCPNVESIVRSAVNKKFHHTFVTAPATLRLFFHDCFVQGCDASIMLASRNRGSEKDSSDNLSLAGDGFDTVIKAKAAVDSVPSCRNKVSCADILALATRDVVVLGGPYYDVELGRLDGKFSSKAGVFHHLPSPDFNLDQLSSLFAKHGLSLTDLVALSGAHSLGFAHCGRFSNRIYNFKSKNKIDPTLNPVYAKELQQMCPKRVDPRIAINMDPVTPRAFDNVYYRNLQQGKGLFTSDQCLFTDKRSRNIVNFLLPATQASEGLLLLQLLSLGGSGLRLEDKVKLGAIVPW